MRRIENRYKIEHSISPDKGIEAIKDAVNPYDAVLISDFESWEKMEAYKVNPLHVVISDYCKERRLERVDVDYEL